MLMEATMLDIYIKTRLIAAMLWAFIVVVGVVVIIFRNRK